MFRQILIICLFVYTPIEAYKFPIPHNGNPPFSFEDCMYRYFACTDDNTYGKWPMNSRICFRHYQFCLAEVKWNRKVVQHGNVKVTYPINVSKPKTDKTHIKGYLHNFACHEVMCSYEEAEFSCGKFGEMKIIYVFFGREKGTSHCPVIMKHGYSHKSSCVVDHAFDPVYNRCNGKNKCKISPKDLDPMHCKDKHPYLEVKYTCSGFKKPTLTSSKSDSQVSELNAMIDQDINTFYTTNRQEYPWVELKFPYSFKVKEVLVFTKPHPKYTDMSTIEVKLFNNSALQDNGVIQTDKNSCFKRSPWDLTFACNSHDSHKGLIIYSTIKGRLAIKEITVVIAKNPHMKEEDKYKPDKHTDKNIYVIVDNSCISNLIIMSCYNYGGKVKIIDYTLGQTKNSCDALNPMLECSKTFNNMIPSCMDEQSCLPTSDKMFQSSINDLKQEATCKNVNYVKFRYTCTGIPKPEITTSSVHNGFKPNFLLYEGDYTDKYFSSKSENNPWIHLFFGTHLAVQGIKITIVPTEEGSASLENIEIRVGKVKVEDGGDIQKNPLCSQYRGPPGDSEKHIVVKCSSYLIGKHLTIQKVGFGKLKIKRLVILLKPEVALSYTYK